MSISFIWHPRIWNRPICWATMAKQKSYSALFGRWQKMCPYLLACPCLIPRAQKKWFRIYFPFHWFCLHQWRGAAVLDHQKKGPAEIIRVEKDYFGNRPNSAVFPIKLNNLHISVLKYWKLFLWCSVSGSFMSPHKKALAIKPCFSWKRLNLCEIKSGKVPAVQTTTRYPSHTMDC